MGGVPKPSVICQPSALSCFRNKTLTITWHTETPRTMFPVTPQAQQYLSENIKSRLTWSMQVKKAQRHQYPSMTLGLDTSAHPRHLPELKHSDIYAYTETQYMPWSDLASRTVFYKSYTRTSLKTTALEDA